MPSVDLERVSADLSSIRDAMRLGKPYTRDDVNRDLVTALCGLLSLVLILFSPLGSKLAFTLGLLPGLIYYLRFTAQQRSQRAANPARWKEEKLTLLALAVAMPLVIAWLLWSPLAGSNEGGLLTINNGFADTTWSTPSNWVIGDDPVEDSEDSIGRLTINNGTLSLAGTGNRESYGSLASAAALYFIGVGLGVLGVIDPNRRRYLAGSIVLIAYGMASPYLTPPQMVLGAAVALMAGGLLSAGITFFQLKSDGDFNQSELA